MNNTSANANEIERIKQRLAALESRYHHGILSAERVTAGFIEARDVHLVLSGGMIRCGYDVNSGILLSADGLRVRSRTGRPGLELAGDGERVRIGPLGTDEYALESAFDVDSRTWITTLRGDALDKVPADKIDGRIGYDNLPPGTPYGVDYLSQITPKAGTITEGDFTITTLSTKAIIDGLFRNAFYWADDLLRTYNGVGDLTSSWDTNGRAAFTSMTIGKATPDQENQINIYDSASRRVLYVEDKVYQAETDFFDVTPFTVGNSSLITNLNADLLDGYHYSDIMNTISALYAPTPHGIISAHHNVTGSTNQLVGLTGANTLGLLTPASTVGANTIPIGGTGGAITWSGAQTFSSSAGFNGTPPFTVVNNTLITNLNADLLDGYHYSDIMNTISALYAPTPHGIISAHHNVTGSTNQLVGLTGANTLGLLTPASTVGANTIPIGGTGGAITWSGAQTFGDGAILAAGKSLTAGGANCDLFSSSQYGRYGYLGRLYLNDTSYITGETANQINIYTGTMAYTCQNVFHSAQVASYERMDDTGHMLFILSSRSNSYTNYMHIRRMRNSYTDVLAGDYMGILRYSGYQGSGYCPAVMLYAIVETVGTGYVDGKVSLNTYKSGTEQHDLMLSAASGLIWNEDGRSNLNARFEGDTNTHLFYIDATNDRVGINDSAPGEKLDVNGNINTTGVIKVDDVRVVGNRVIDSRISATPNCGDTTTDNLIDAIRDCLIAHGLIAAA